MFTNRQKDFLEAANNIISKEGFSKLTVRNVASAVGVTEPSVYRHFPSKLVLLESLLEDLQLKLMPHFYNFLKFATQGAGSYRVFIKGLFSEFKNNPAYALFVFSEEVFHNEAQLKDKLQLVMARNISLLAEAFEILQQNNDCRKDLSPNELALNTLAMIRLTVSRWKIMDETEDLHAMAEEMISIQTRLFDIAG